MTDPYSVLGITPGADDETLKKAYRQKCKQYHPDLHPNDPAAEEKFKEVQAAYSEVLRRKNGGGPQQSYGGGAQSRQGGGQSYSQGGTGSYTRQSGYGYQEPFSGFAYGPFGFGFYSSANQQTYTSGQESGEMRAAANYIRSGFYEEALNTLNGISAAERTAQWHYYAA